MALADDCQTLNLESVIGFNGELERLKWAGEKHGCHFKAVELQANV